MERSKVSNLGGFVFFGEVKSILIDSHLYLFGQNVSLVTVGWKVV